jgi:hypothetical protein
MTQHAGQPGRKGMFTDKNARELLAFLSTGLTIEAAAEQSCGISRRTVAYWCAKSAADGADGALFDSRYLLVDWPTKGQSALFHEAVEAVRSGRVRVSVFHGHEVPDAYYRKARDTPRFKAHTGEPKLKPLSPEEAARREALRADYLPAPEPATGPEWARPPEPHPERKETGATVTPATESRERPPPEPASTPEWARPPEPPLERPSTPLVRDLESRLDALRTHGPRNPRPEGQKSAPDGVVKIYGRNEASDVVGQANQPTPPPWARPEG